MESCWNKEQHDHVVLDWKLNGYSDFVLDRHITNVNFAIIKNRKKSYWDRDKSQQKTLMKVVSSAVQCGK